MKTHCFPDKITAHKLTFRDGSRLTLLVPPSETYGKALARSGYSDDDVTCISLEDSPLHYEPDNSIASRQPLAQLKTNMKYCLYYFSNESGSIEFVVVSDQGEQAVRDEFCSTEVGLIQSFPIDGDATSMPCDRKLSK